MLFFIVALLICSIKSQQHLKEDFLYYFGDNTYWKAIDVCNENGLAMARTDTEESAKALYKYAASLSLKEYWINANSLTEESIWVDNDGFVVPTNLWAPGRPNHLNVSKCVIGNYENSTWKWSNTRCTLTAATICDYGFRYIGHYNYEVGYEECLKHGLRMLRADTEKIAKAVHKYAYSFKRNMWYYTDAIYLIKEKIWVHKDGTAAPMNLWRNGSPSILPVLKCAGGSTSEPSWQWVNSFCNNQASVICMRSPYVQKEYGLVYVGDYNYNEANRACFKLGFTLVRADTEQSAKNLHIFITSRSLGPYWIDANNILNENIWVHYDGTPAGNKFMIPNTFTENQCATGSFDAKNVMWWSRSCSLKIATVCEHNYRYIGKYCYFKANQECVKRGLTLARADTEKRAKALYVFAKSFSTQLYWIDANRLINTSGVMHYDGTFVLNSLWNPEYDKHERQYCIVGNTIRLKYKWASSTCHEPYLAICEHSFLYVGEYNHEQANRECFKRGLTLARGDTEQSAKTLYYYAIAHGLGNYWIDANNLKNLSKYVHYDGTLATNNLLASKTSGNVNENRCIMGSLYQQSWKWQKSLCILPFVTICEKRKRFIGKYTFDDANKECLKIGLKLARVEFDEVWFELLNYGITISSEPYWIDAMNVFDKNEVVHYDGSFTNNIIYEDYILSKYKIRVGVIGRKSSKNDYGLMEPLNVSEKANTICI